MIGILLCGGFLPGLVHLQKHDRNGHNEINCKSNQSYRTRTCFSEQRLQDSDPKYRRSGAGQQ